MSTGRAKLLLDLTELTAPTHTAQAEGSDVKQGIKGRDPHKSKTL